RRAPIGAGPHEAADEFQEDQMNREVRLAGKRELEVLLQALEAPDFRPAAYHARAQIPKLQIAGELRGICSEAVAVVVHLLAEQSHRAAMLMPGYCARLVNQSSAVADRASHDVQIASAARHASYVKRFVEAAHLRERLAAQAHVYAGTE